MLIVTDKPPVPTEKLSRIKATVTYTARPHGSHWSGVKHADLIDELRNALRKNDFAVAQPTAWTACNGGNVYANFRVVGTRPNYDLWVGVSASNVARERWKVYCGAVDGDGTRLVSACLMGAKFTVTLDLQRECQSLAAGWLEAAHGTDALIRDLKAHQLTGHDVNSVLLAAAKQRVMMWRQIGTLTELFHAGKGRTAWDLLRAYSVGAKVAVPDQMKNLYKFRLILGKKLAKEAA